MDGGNERSCHNILSWSSCICDSNTSIVQKGNGNEAPNRSNGFRWYSRFRDGRELAEDEKRGGCPISTRNEVNIAPVAYFVKCDHQIASRMVAESLNIPKTVVLRILNRVWERKVVCTFCSTLHDTWAKERSSHVLLRHYRDGRSRQKFFNKIITGDETRCFAYDPKTKRQSSE